MLCILCLTKSEQKIYIFDENGLRLNISSIITKHFWLQPSAEDCNSKVICCSCWEALDSFHKFYQKVEEVHLRLFDGKNPLEDSRSDEENFDTYLGSFNEDVILEESDDSQVNLHIDDVKRPMVQLEGNGGRRVVEPETDVKKPLALLETDFKSAMGQLKVGVERPLVLLEADFKNAMGQLEAGVERPVVYLQTGIGRSVVHQETDDKKPLVHLKADVKMPVVYSQPAFEIPVVNLQADVERSAIYLENKVDKSGVQRKTIEQSDAQVKAIGSISESNVHRAKLRNRKKLTKHYEQSDTSDNDSEALLNSKTKQEKKLTDDDNDYKSLKRKDRSKIVTNNQENKNKRLSCKEFDKFIKQNMELSCQICHVELASFFILKEHYQSVHNEVGYASCCSKKFNSRHALVHHILLHQNPETYKCEKCGKVMANRKSLSYHVKTHVNRERIFHCEKCRKSFSRKEKLERHMKTHEKLEQVCEQCGKVTRDKHALRNHKLREHSNVPKQRLQCQKCGAYLADSSTLHTHMKYQHPKTADIYKCNICGKISTTGYGLKRHILYMHKCDRRHKCSLCEKGFKTAQRLREHMTTHTGEVLYTCPHCPKTFNSNANMHSHRKKMHRKEWEENRRHPHMGSTANPE